MSSLQIRLTKQSIPLSAQQIECLRQQIDYVKHRRADRGTTKRNCVSSVSKHVPRPLQSFLVEYVTHSLSVLSGLIFFAINDELMTTCNES